MNSLYVLLFVAAAVFADSVDPHQFIPCSFELMTYTSFSSGGSELTSSIDAVYHDHDNLWRWDSEFKGIPGIFEGHSWSVIWRPDDGASYHNFGHKCLKNNNGTKMYPYPYEWLESKTDGIEWSSSKTKYNGKDAIVYTGVATSSTGVKKFHAKVNLFVLAKSEEFVFGNGTVTSNLVDISFDIVVNKYATHVAIPAAQFVPMVPICPATTMPVDATKDFQKYCYETKPVFSSSGAVITNPSLLFLLATLLAALLIFVAV